MVEKEDKTQTVPIINENMAKDLELVRSVVVQLEEENKKLKEKQNEQLGEQMFSFEEEKKELLNKISKLQTKLAEETKCKDQMT